MAAERNASNFQPRCRSSWDATVFTLQKPSPLLVASWSSSASGFPASALPELCSLDFSVAVCPLIPCINLLPGQNVQGSFCFLDWSLMVSEVYFLKEHVIGGLWVDGKEIDNWIGRRQPQMFDSHEAILLWCGQRETNQEEPPLAEPLAERPLEEKHVQGTGHCSRGQSQPSRAAFSSPGLGVLQTICSVGPQHFGDQHSAFLFPLPGGSIYWGYPWWVSHWWGVSGGGGGQAASLCGPGVVRAARVSWRPDGEVRTSPREPRLRLGTPRGLDLWTVLLGRGERVLCVGGKNEIDVWWLEGKTKALAICLPTLFNYFPEHREDSISHFPFQFHWCI